MTNINSDIVANMVASPPVHSDVTKFGGRMRIAQGAFETVAASFDADGDTITLIVLPSTSIVHSIRIANDDLDTGTTSAFNLGVYSWDEVEGLGAAVDEDYFATAVEQLRAASAMVELVAEAAWDIAKYGQPLWEAVAGLSKDPVLNYAICMTETAATAGAQAGTLAYDIRYTLD